MGSTLLVPAAELTSVRVSRGDSQPGRTEIPLGVLRPVKSAKLIHQINPKISSRDPGLRSLWALCNSKTALLFFL